MSDPDRRARNPGYRANNPDRCFFCKDELYTKLESVARTRGINIVVARLSTISAIIVPEGEQRRSMRA